MPLFFDQISHTVKISSLPQRIISVVPSQTELLYDLGLRDEVVGVTKFCVHPKEWFQTKTRVGGTKQLDLQKINELKPNLILANKEENKKEQIEELAKHFPVWISDVRGLPSACAMIMEVGKIAGKENESQQLIENIKFKFDRLDANRKKIRTAYFIWRKPYLTIGSDTFIHQMLSHAGFENIFSDKTRYPPIELNELITRNCELLLLSSEPYPFSQKHIDELKPQLPNTKVLLADGELFSWYGSRMLKAPEYFQQLYTDALR